MVQMSYLQRRFLFKLIGTYQTSRNEISSEEYSLCDDFSVIYSRGPVGTHEDELGTIRRKVCICRNLFNDWDIGQGIQVRLLCM